MSAPASEHEASQRFEGHPGLLASSLRSNRLTLLACTPGAARDAMLRRGLMPLLHPRRIEGGRAELALRFDGWGTLPLQALRGQIDRVAPTAPSAQPPATLADQLLAANRHQRLRLLLVLDAFERHLIEPLDRPGIVRFDLELAACITDPAVPLHVLLVADDAANPALQRYQRWLPDFGRDWLRLPASPPEAAAQWSDTDIQSLPQADESMRSTRPHDDELDLLLDDATPAQPAPIDKGPAPMAHVEEAAEPPLIVADPATAVPDASSRWPAAAATPPAPPPASSPWRASAQSSPAPPPSPEMPQFAQPPARWWKGAFRLTADIAMLVAGMWLVASWMIGSDGPALRTGRSPAGEITRSTPASAVAESPPVVAEAPPVVAKPPPAAPTPPAPTIVAPTEPPRSLTLTMPIDDGAAAPIIDQLVRFVAAPAGIPLKVVAANAPATLAVWRRDALAAARAANAQPLRVLAPLFNEQIQIVVRNDAPWDYLHEIKGLRLNIGRTDGARAHTARTLYRQLFGVPLPPEMTDELDEGAAMQQMLRRGGPIDAMIVVSEVPLLSRLPVAARGQLRELPFDANDRRTAGALQSYSPERRTANERARLAVTSFLVCGAAPHPQENALRALVVALCRAQPSLQAKGSPLLRGFTLGQQPQADWPYVLPRSQGADCPVAPPTSDAPGGGKPAPAPPPKKRNPAP